MRLARVSYRRLDYWDRCGLVSPSHAARNGTGSQRLYTAEDVERVKLVGALTDLGMSLVAIRRLVDAGGWVNVMHELERAVDEVRGRFRSLEAAVA